jgi:ribosomal protein L32
LLSCHLLLTSRPTDIIHPHDITISPHLTLVPCSGAAVLVSTTVGVSKELQLVVEYDEKWRNSSSLSVVSQWRLPTRLFHRADADFPILQRGDWWLTLCQRCDASYSVQYSLSRGAARRSHSRLQYCVVQSCRQCHGHSFLENVCNSFQWTVVYSSCV